MGINVRFDPLRQTNPAFIYWTSGLLGLRLLATFKMRLGQETRLRAMCYSEQENLYLLASEQPIVEQHHLLDSPFPVSSFGRFELEPREIIFFHYALVIRVHWDFEYFVVPIRQCNEDVRKHVS